MRFIITFCIVLTTCLSHSQVLKWFWNDTLLMSEFHPKTGFKKEWYKSGKLKLSGIESGTPIQKAKSNFSVWYENGNLQFQWKMDEEGLIEICEYFPNGKLREKIKAKATADTSATVQNYYVWTYCNNGFLTNEFCNSCAGLKSFKVFFCDGKLKIDASKVGDAFSGSYKEYHNSGALKLEGQYKEIKNFEEGMLATSKKIGEWRIYDEKGKKLRLEVYNQEGKLISQKDFK